MKLKHLFFNALAVMAFAACSSEAEEIKPADKSTTATLQLDMTGQYGTGSTDQTRTLSLDGTEYPRFIHEEGVTDWSTHCFIRNEAGTVQFYALVDWNATTDSDGNISLHIKNSTLTLQNSAGSDVSNTETLPKAGERWYIAGIAGGGVLDATNSNVDFQLKNSSILNSNKEAIVPLAFGWTGFTIPSNTERAPQISVQFQPQGTLFSVYVNNKTNVNNLPITGSIVMTSNAIDLGVFDYSLDAARADYTSAPKWTSYASGFVHRSRAFRLDKGQASNVYLWAMPRAKSEEPAEGFRTKLRIGGYTSYVEGTVNKPEIESRSFTKGMTYAYGRDVIRPDLPQDFISTYNLANATTFATSHANDASGYFTWEEARAIPVLAVDNTFYRYPSRSAMLGIFPNRLSNPTRTVATFKSDITATDVAESIDINYGDFSCTSDYIGTTTGKAYALRYKAGEDLSRLTAVRYQYISNPDGAGNALKVTFRYLGFDGAATTITQVADETYWQSNTEKDKTFIFPATGSIDDGVLINQGIYGHYWTWSDHNGSTTGWSSIFTTSGVYNATGIRASKKAVRMLITE